MITRHEHRAIGADWISRFPCEVHPCLLGVPDRAGTWCTLRNRVHGVVPSTSAYGVGVPEGVSFAAEYSALTFSCQRFDVVLASDSARLGAGGALTFHRMTLSFTGSRRF